MNDLKENIRKKNLELVDDLSEMAKKDKKKSKESIYKLKGCDKHKKFTIFELLVESPPVDPKSKDVNHSV